MFIKDVNGQLINLLAAHRIAISSRKKPLSRVEAIMNDDTNFPEGYCLFVGEPEACQAYFLRLSLRLDKLGKLIDLDAWVYP